MKKILSIIIPLLVFTVACEKDFGSLNDDNKAYYEVPASSLFSNGQKNLADAITTPNVNSGIFRLLAQQWTETTYVNESRYDLTTRNIPRNFWNTMYRDVIKDFTEAKRLATEDQQITESVRKNQLALADLMIVYSYSILVDTYGDIPYSEAMDINNIQPKYDDAKTIYFDLLTRIDDDLSSIDINSESFGSSDIIYKGDLNKWIKLGNSLKLRLGMMLADADPAKSKEVVESSVSNIFTSPDDNAVFHYQSSPPNTNPVWVNLVQSGRKDFVAANTMVNAMIGLNDPRIPYFFTKDANGNYSGGIYGSKNNYAKFSKPATRITEPDYETLFLDFVEVEFFLAEAVERGYNVPGSAQSHYEAAITASINYWGGDDNDATVYLLQPDVNYLTAPGSYKEKIGRQKWIAMYNRGFEGWTEWRRLDYPNLTPPPLAQTPIPLRFTYSVDEQNINTTNYEAASAKIGGDVVTSKLFWDLN